MESLDKYINQLKDQFTDIVTNSNNEFMEDDLTKVKDKVPSICVAVSSYLKVHFQFWKMFLQAHKGALDFAEIFQSVHF